MVATLQEPGVDQTGDQPARAPTLADEPLSDLAHGQRPAGFLHDDEHLPLRGREPGWAQQLGKCARTLALRAEDQVAQLLDSVHAHEYT
jgi:hypothetical protein